MSQRPDADAADDRGAYVVDTRNRLRRRPASSPRERPLPPLKPSGRPPNREPAPVRRESRETREPAPYARRRRPWRAVLVVLLVLVLAWLAFLVWVPVNAWNNVARVDNNPAGNRPVVAGGSNYLLVGSDSRTGLTPEQQKQLSTGGGDDSKRTDSIILVHVPGGGGGKAALVSIPRDSYVPIPGHGSNKINAAFSIGGAKLLTQTVEQNTGVHIDGYLEIGFGGFASVVDSLGGVDVCVPFDMKDPLAGIDLKKGCQTLDGPNALGFVRARYSDPRGDIGRAERQRQFLGALLKKAATPSTVLVPWRYKGFADAAAAGLVVGQTTSFSDAVKTLQALRGVDGGDTLSLVVPIETASLQTSNAGVAVKWNTAQAKALFTTIAKDEPLTVPPAGTTGGAGG